MPDREVAPLRPSALLQDLLPDGVHAVEGGGDGRRDWLLPLELACVARAVPKRVAEFAAGRACARQALAALGVHGFALCSGPDRSPLWPKGIVGSITHTADFCAAAVARADKLSGLGIDAEMIDRVGPSLWPSICTADERQWLQERPADERQVMAALLFSAKEAYYKWQYPRTRNWVGFHDLSIRPADGRFTVVLHKSLPMDAGETRALVCRYAIRERIVVTAVASEAVLG